MKTKLQIALATIAPSISIRTIWEHDQDSGPISKECDGFDKSEDDDWQAWQSEIRATAIVTGEEITGSAYLGGTWEKYGDDPATSNPTISGYENQMTQEALEDMPEASEEIAAQICAALAYLKEESRRSYDAQRAEIEAARIAASI
jgi:hypothetical protein